MSNILLSIIYFPLPLISLIIFTLFKFFPPSNISPWYGYRTKRSTSNSDNWQFAQKFSANLGLTMSVITLIIQIIVTIVVDNEQLKRNIVGVSWILGMVIIIYLTENKLKSR